MRVLFIGPLPNPITGHSLACKVFLEELNKQHEVKVVNLSKGTFKQGVGSFSRILEILRIILVVWKNQKESELIYLTISESFAGNFKDLLIYLVCFRKLSRMVVHLHGGSLKKLIFDKSKLLFKINQYFIGRIGGVIVLGPSHVSIFDGLISKNKIHTVPNFSEDYLFTNETEISRKFKDAQLLRVLFLSNFIVGKGFDRIIDAYLNLSEELQRKVAIDFAGAFDSETQKKIVIGKINQLSRVCYHGVVEGAKKKDLFARAHIFCLPTSLHEGQPISILEAYASGCVVITTDRGGIRDIFQDKVNGFKVEGEEMMSLKQTLEQCIQDRVKLTPIAMTNFNCARKRHRASHYNSALMKIVNAFGGIKHSRLLEHV